MTAPKLLSISRSLLGFKVASPAYRGASIIPVHIVMSYVGLRGINLPVQCTPPPPSIVVSRR